MYNEVFGYGILYYVEEIYIIYIYYVERFTLKSYVTIT